jgi:hypothetical protein
MSTRDRFRTTLETLATKAKTTLPDSAGRIDSAVRLVLSGDVELFPDGTATVGSRSHLVISAKSEQILGSRMSNQCDA